MGKIVSNHEVSHDQLPFLTLRPTAHCDNSSYSVWHEVYHVRISAEINKSCVVGPNVTGPVLIGPNVTSVGGDEFTFTCHLSDSVSPAASVQYQVAMAYDGQVDTTNIKTATSQDVTFTTTDFAGHFQQLVIQHFSTFFVIQHFHTIY
jgi:hypothetical protein